MVFINQTVHVMPYILLKPNRRSSLEPQNTNKGKGKGSCIDLILTNRRHSFKHTSSIETGLSNHHHLISSMKKTTFEKEESKVLVYRDYKNSSFNSFKSELLFKFHHNNVTFTSFENNFVNVLNQQAPKKSKVFRGNQKLHLNKSLRSAFMNVLD